MCPTASGSLFLFFLFFFPSEGLLSFSLPRIPSSWPSLGKRCFSLCQPDCNLKSCLLIQV